MATESAGLYAMVYEKSRDPRATAAGFSQNLDWQGPARCASPDHMGSFRTIARVAALAFGLALGLALPRPALAQDAVPGVVVELYSSQGCSSCPPADALLADLAQDPGVIPLALHVDYWDYLGWQDEFARPQYTDRQKAYAKAKRSKMLFTPQMVVGGSDVLVGTKPGEVAAAIARHMAAGQSVRLTVRRDGDRLVIRAEAVPPSDRVIRVQLVRYRPSVSGEIERGENAGHRFDYTNIVTDWSRLADWTATAPFETEAAVQGTDKAVVILQEAGMGRILAAAALR